MLCNNFIAFSNGRANVGFGFFNLILKLLLELAELGALEVRSAREKSKMNGNGRKQIYLMRSQSCIHFQLFAIIMERIDRWAVNRASF